ncbi:MAG TPA: NAD+ synthase, partial [bacterium]|nr:NAD+ synthase [bacterium]
GTECPVFSLTTEHGICGFCVNIGADISCQNGPTAKQAKSGASIIFNIHSSPYHMEKFKRREKIITTAAKKSNVFIAYVNLVGGQDELVFNGQSFVASPDGKIVSKAEAFKEQLLVTDIKIETKKVKGVSDFILKPMEKPFITTFLAKPLCREAEIYEALLLGLKDYVEKNRFGKVILGISGGIDSAVVATIAVDALGKQRVVGVFMPGQYSSHRSEADARELAKNLGIELFIISIKEIFSVYLHKLRSYFKNMPFDITEENLQARIRGNLLMALSNRFGYLVLASGNKSEMSTGYATLYGDMAGGFAVIKDVSKTLVYKIAAYRNSAGGIIPKNILVKEPTAELRPGQKDSDTLPRYNILDKILNMYIEQNKDVEAIIKAGFNEDLVKKIIKMVDKNEYKRRQAPPGIKITARSLGKDRKMPITNRYHI